MINGFGRFLGRQGRVSGIPYYDVSPYYDSMNSVSLFCVMAIARILVLSFYPYYNVSLY